MKVPAVEAGGSRVTTGRLDESKVPGGSAASVLMSPALFTSTLDHPFI